MTLRKESFWQAAGFTDERDMRGGPLGREEVYGSRNVAVRMPQRVHVKSRGLHLRYVTSTWPIKVETRGRGRRHHSNCLEEAGPLDYGARRTDSKRH